MTNPHGFTLVGPGSDATARVVARFIEAFEARDAGAIPQLVADDCVMEAMQPAPDGQRVEGFEANVRFWQAMVTDPTGTFEVEVSWCSETAQSTVGGTALGKDLRMPCAA
jgi:ketosteroid isomerase-like protein